MLDVTFIFIYLFIFDVTFKKMMFRPTRGCQKKKKIDYDSLKAQRMVSFFFFLFFGHLS